MKHKLFKGGIAALVAIALASAGMALPAQAANGEMLSDVITEVSFGQSEAIEFAKFRTTFTMNIPDSADAGDKFAVTLPAELATRGTSDFVINAPDGEKLADVVYTDTKTLTGTFTGYVDNHVDITATAFVTNGWDTQNISDPNVRNEFKALQFTAPDGSSVTAPLTYIPAPNGEWKPTTQLDPAKNGGFSNVETEGADTPYNALSWSIGTPLRPEGYTKGVTVVDTTQKGNELNCVPHPITGQPNVSVFQRISETESRPFPTERYTVECINGKLTVAFGYLYSNDIVQISFQGNITDASLTEYKNDATFTIPGEETVTVTATVKRSANGGDGAGNQFVSVGDVVFTDYNNNGVQGEGESSMEGVELTIEDSDGNPAMDRDGNVVGPVTSTMMTGYLFTNLKALPAGTTYRVSVDPKQPALKNWLNTTPTTLSSTELTANGMGDLDVDFGFVPVVVITDPPVPPVVVPSPEPTPPVVPPVVEPTPEPTPPVTPPAPEPAPEPTPPVVPPVVEPTPEPTPPVTPPAPEPAPEPAPPVTPPVEEPAPPVAPPVEEPPVVEPPVEAPPVVEEPVVETPVVEEPVVETPVEEPVVEAPQELASTGVNNGNALAFAFIFLTLGAGMLIARRKFA